MNEEFYIDFDGVIMDTQGDTDRLFMEYGGDIKNPAWNEYLRCREWANYLLTCKEIDNSIDVLKELYKLKKRVYILSRVFSVNEARDKTLFLRDKGVYQDFIAVPGRISKSKVVIPNKSRLLVDDSNDNVIDWRNNKGSAILIPNEEKDLSFLLKR
ncbi:MAG: hypothetical protein J6X02_01115 [Bacilli bacterium]|nr:hypothetical protein [Bacilli bacterium]